MSGSKVNED
jgi:CxxC motif-containing protein (DUF1111 family)